MKDAEARLKSHLLWSKKIWPFGVDERCRIRIKIPSSVVKKNLAVWGRWKMHNQHKRSNENILSFENTLIFTSRSLETGIRLNGRYSRDEDIRWHSLGNTASGIRKSFRPDPGGLAKEPSGMPWKSLWFPQETSRFTREWRLFFSLW